MTATAFRACRSPRAISALLALALLAGCYEIDAEFLAPSEAQYIPGLPGTYTGDQGTTTEITELPGNEYHFRRIYPEGDVTTGTFRAVRLYGDVYLMQLRDDEGGLYAMYSEFTVDDSGATFWELDYVDEMVQPMA